jgi:hypothetical protein
VIRQAFRVIKSYVHPGRPVRATGSSEFAELLFLARKKADLIGFLSHAENRFFQYASCANDLVAARWPETANGTEGDSLGDRRVKFTSAAPTKLGASGNGTPRRPRMGTLVWNLAGLAALLLLVAGYLVRENGRLRNDFTQEQARRIQLEKCAQALQKRIDDQTPAARPTEASPPQQILAFVLSPQNRGIASIAVITLPPGVDRVAFRLILETDDFARYRVKLRDLALNQIIWRSEGLKAESRGASRAVSVVVPGNVFKQQNYSLELAGMPAAGAEEFVGAYAFKVGR